MLRCKSSREHAIQMLSNKMAKSKHERRDYFSTSIYGISVMFVGVTTSDTPIIVDNDVIA